MLECFCFRLMPGQDLKKELLRFCAANQLRAVTLLSGVGSLTQARLRFADAKQESQLQGPFEIVSLTGTLSAQAAHLHISIADSSGLVRGGHLLDGCLIHTTAEIVLLENKKWEFQRKEDPSTGYKELVVTTT